MSEEKVGIVYNACYGVFSISDAAIRRYAELKGIALYPEKDEYRFVTYWTKPGSEPRDYEKDTLGVREFERTDPILVKVVEELGGKADGDCANLAIQYVPKGTPYRIDEYDGYESVILAADQEWKVA